jgi:hypothetical protein
MQDEDVTGDRQMQEDNSNGDDDASMAGFIGSLEPSTHDVVADMLLQQLGSSGRSYKREARAGFKNIVSEIFSPPRVTGELLRRGRRHLVPGLALDITCMDPDDGTPWDFSIKAKREKARKLLRSQKPYLLIGSPECRAFSTWQYLNESKTEGVYAMRRAKVQAVIHVNFVAELYNEQVESGRYFLHEHPIGASSWNLPSIKQLLEMPGVAVAHADQCQYGAEVKSGRNRGQPIKKPTGFMTNSSALHNELSARCQGVAGECSRHKWRTASAVFWLACKASCDISSGFV